MPFSAVGYFGAVRAVGRIVGQDAGLGATGDRVFLAGLNAGRGSNTADLIVIGRSAFDSSVTDANANGSTLIGNNTGGALANFTTGQTPGAVTIIGHNAAALMTHGASNVFLGDRILSSLVGGAANNNSMNVVIGSRVGELLTPAAPSFGGNVVVGARCFTGSPANMAPLNSVVIGSEACRDSGVAGNSMDQCVVIGRRAGMVSSGATNTLIGANCCATLSGTANSNNTVVGANASFAGADNTSLGAENASNGGAFNLFLGSGIGSGSPKTGSRCILIGAGSGTNETAATSDLFIVETFVAAVRRNVLYGDMAAGNLAVGLSTPGTNRDFQGTNNLKLINGTRGAGNPVGGGFFYVLAGVLHWVGSAGTDTVIAPA